MKQLVQAHTAGQRQRQGWKSGLSYFAVLAATFPCLCAGMSLSVQTHACLHHHTQVAYLLCAPKHTFQCTADTQVHGIV